MLALVTLEMAMLTVSPHLTRTFLRALLVEMAISSRCQSIQFLIVCLPMHK